MVRRDHANSTAHVSGFSVGDGVPVSSTMAPQVPGSVMKFNDPARAPDTLAVLTSDWYWEQDAQYRYTSVIQPETTRRPVDPAQLLGRRRWEMTSWRPLNTTWEAHLADLDARRPFHDLQYVVLSAGDGKRRYMSCSGEPRYDGRGSFIGYRGTSRDVSGQWEERHKLDETQRLLRMASRLARFGGWSVDLETMACTWSEGVCDILEIAGTTKLPLEQALGFYPPADRELLRQAFLACARDGTPYDLELQIVTARGRSLWVRAIGEARRDAQGVVVGVEGAFQDIQASKEAADERQKAAERMTATLDSLADGFILLDAGWRIRYVNPEGAKIVRRPRAGMLGRHLWEEFPEARGSRFESEYRRAMDERVTVDFTEFFAPLDLWCRVRAWPSADGIAISFVDVTAQKRAEEQLLRLNAELEERVRQRTQDLAATTRELEVLSYAIAHDLRAPLAAIDGFGRALEEAEGPALSSRGRGYLRRIRAATQRMDEMTDGLLALARISGQPSDWMALNLAALAADAWRTIGSQDPARRVSIRIAPRLAARGQRAQVLLVLQNLLANAWKFTAGVDDPFVEVGSAGEEGAQRVFFVADNGAGFDPAYAHRLFKPFHRLHAADEFPGTGLGLAVVQKVVQLHGGRVWAQAGPDGGATFFFTLPAPEAAHGPKRAEGAAACTGSSL